MTRYLFTISFTAEVESDDAAEQLRQAIHEHTRREAQERIRELLACETDDTRAAVMLEVNMHMHLLGTSVVEIDTEPLQA